MTISNLHRTKLNKQAAVGSSSRWDCLLLLPTAAYICQAIMPKYSRNLCLLNNVR